MNVSKYFFLNHSEIITPEIKAELLKNRVLGSSDFEPKDPIKEKLKDNPQSISEYPNPSKELQQFVMAINVENFKYIKNPESETILEYIAYNPEYILEVENPTYDMQYIAMVNKNEKRKEFIESIPNLQTYAIEKLLTEHPSNICYFENQTEEMQLWALKSTKSRPPNLEELKNPSYEIQKFAVQKEPYNIKFIKDPSYELKEIAITNDPDIIKIKKIKWEKELLLLAVSKDGHVIEYINDPSKELILAAINSKPDSVFRVNKNGKKFIHKDLLYYAIDKDPFIIKDHNTTFLWDETKKIDHDVQFYALSKDWKVIMFLGVDIQITPEEFQKIYLLQTLKKQGGI